MTLESRSSKGITGNFAEGLGAPIILAAPPVLAFLLRLNAVLLGWRILVRAGFVTAAYGLGEGLRSIPRMLVGNLIAMLAVKRAIGIHAAGGPRRWEKTQHIFPAEEQA